MSHQQGSPVPVLITGVPRSGTTWVGRILGQREGARFVSVPDNETHDPIALRVKRDLGRLPRFDPVEDHATCSALWAGAPTGGKLSSKPSARIARRLLRLLSIESIDRAIGSGRSANPVLIAAARLALPREPTTEPGALVVKSVHAIRALEWISLRWRPQVVVVRRHPLDMVASWLELGWPRINPSGILRSHAGPEIDASRAVSSSA